MADSGRLRLQDVAGKTVELMRWTCQRCGYTMLFDLDVVRAHPLPDRGVQEVLPE
jgi:predicted nucleic-acid-binding Zn-ribbon protein